MKTAVCISGQCRTLNQTYENIRQNLLETLGSHDVFMYVSKDDQSLNAHLLNPTVIDIVEDRYIDEGALVNGKNCRFKTGVQAYLQQLHALKMSNRMRLMYQKAHDIQYDCVIRCRPDILFSAPVCPVDQMDLDYIYLPDFHHFDGCNDRFAIGNSENMTVYFNKIDSIHDFVSEFYNHKGIPLSAEMFTISHLQANDIPTRTLPIRFNRVRAHGITNDLKKTNRKVKAVG